MYAASHGEEWQGVARRCALVAVVQAADLWNGNHTARSQRRDRTWKGCILVQPEVRSCYRVVGDVLVQNAAKAGSRQHDDVIEALASDRSDESFDVGVGARRRQDFLNADGIHVIERMILGDGAAQSSSNRKRPKRFLVSIQFENVRKSRRRDSNGRDMFRTHSGDNSDAGAPAAQFWFGSDP